MWKKLEVSEPAAPEPPVVSRPNVETPRERAIIGPSITIKGDLSGEEDLLIQGRVEGKIELKQHSVIIGRNGRVKADIYGRVITVEGEVHGNLYGEEKAVIRQAGGVHGNIVSPRVVLEEGSRFKGSIEMESRISSGPNQPAGESVQESKPARESGSRESGSDVKRPGLGLTMPPPTSKP